MKNEMPPDNPETVEAIAAALYSGRASFPTLEVSNLKTAAYVFYFWGVITLIPGALIPAMIWGAVERLAVTPALKITMICVASAPFVLAYLYLVWLVLPGKYMCWRMGVAVKPVIAAINKHRATRSEFDAACRQSTGYCTEWMVCGLQRELRSMCRRNTRENAHIRS